MIKNLLSDDEPEVESKKSPARSSTSVLGLFDSAETDDRDAEHDQTVIIPSEPETMAETVRRTGLAWSAGIAFFAAVVFMIILGWGADVLLGTSPWGIVGGIVLGSVIGFIQFFRITSQIFKK
jgi:F0F1-type ATP synthase assembly protein I